MTALLERIRKAPFSPALIERLEQAYLQYSLAIQKEDLSDSLFGELINCMSLLASKKFSFPHHHKALKNEGFDYQDFGLRFTRPLIKIEESKLFGEKSLDQIHEYLGNGDNIFLLANHQTELDPQILDILLKEKGAKAPWRDLGQKILFVAGERVVRDPIALPFTLGRDILFIYSKRYSGDRANKQHHNRHSITKLQELLAKGGQCIFVAPSGGRDRYIDGLLTPSPFDRRSLTLFSLLAKKSQKNCHFFPLSLHSYPLLPPPQKQQENLGEKRFFARDRVFASFLPPLETRKKAEDFCSCAYEAVLNAYQSYTL